MAQRQMALKQVVPEEQLVALRASDGAAGVCAAGKLTRVVQRLAHRD